MSRFVNLDIIHHILTFSNINEICKLIKLNKPIYQYFIRFSDYIFRQHKFLKYLSARAFFIDYINNIFIHFESGELKLCDIQSFLINSETFGYKQKIIKIIDDYKYISRIYGTLIDTRLNYQNDFERSIIKKKEWYRKAAHVFVQFGATTSPLLFVEAVVAMDKNTVRFMLPNIHERTNINTIPIIYELQARRAQEYVKYKRHNQRTIFISSIVNTLHSKFRKKNWFDYSSNRHWTPKQYYDYILTILEN